MGSLERRLVALEAQLTPPEGKRRVFIPRALERYWHELDNARRAQSGFKPLPVLEYTKEDYADDLRTLREHIPVMRSDSGWQTEEGRAFLDEWERNVTERIERHEYDHTE